MAENKYTLTKQGHENLKLELRNLLDVERPQVLLDIENARAFGDLSENADYDAARNRQSEVEGRIGQIEHILQNAVVVEFTKNIDKVATGNIVTIAFDNGRPNMTFQIVGHVEADPLNGTISFTSPIAMAIMGKKPGDKATVNVAKPYTVEVLSISLDK